MKARITSQDGVMIVHLSGYINFETVPPLRKACEKLLDCPKVIFNLRELSFVGSSGITGFVEILKEFSQNRNQPLKICAASSEFQRVFRSGFLTEMQFFESEDLAKGSYRYHEAVSGEHESVPIEWDSEAVQPAMPSLSSETE